MLLTWNTLEEAATYLSNKTNKAWTVRDVIGACDAEGIFLHIQLQIKHKNSENLPLGARESEMVELPHNLDIQSFLGGQGLVKVGRLNDELKIFEPGIKAEIEHLRLSKTALHELLKRLIEKNRKQSAKTTQKKMSKSGAKTQPVNRGVNFAIYQKLRDYCMQDIRQYINPAEDDMFREMLSKTVNNNELLALILDEKQRASYLSQSIDLTPRERAASYLLNVISNYRTITWHREPNPPYGYEQSPPLTKIEEDTLVYQTRQAISEYVCHLPEREANALLLAWEASLVPKQSPDTAKTALKDKQNAAPETEVTPKKETAREYTKVRRNALDPAIDEAIKQAGNMQLADVFLKLKELALSSFSPFTGAIEGKSLCYTNSNDQPAKLTRNALSKRLAVRRNNAV